MCLFDDFFIVSRVLLLWIQLSRDTMPDAAEPRRVRDWIQLRLVSGGRKMKFNAIGGVGLLRCCSVKVRKRVFMGGLLIEDPKSLTRNRVALGRDAMPIVKHKNRGCG